MKLSKIPTLGTDFVDDYGFDGTVDYSYDEAGDYYSDYTPADYTPADYTADYADTGATDYTDTTGADLVQGDDGSLTWTDTDGTTYTEDTDGNTLVQNTDGSYTAFLVDGVVYSFDANGNETTNADGNAGPQQGETPADKGKVSSLAKAADMAMSKIAESKQNPKPKPLPLRTVKPLPTLAASAKSATLAGMSMGTILLLGATGAALLYFNQRKR